MSRARGPSLLCRVGIATAMVFGFAGLAGAAPWSARPPGRIVYPAAAPLPGEVQGGSASLFTAAADGTGSAQLTGSTSFHSDYAPRWSPDGRQVAFTRFQRPTTYENRLEVGVVNADGTAPRALTGSDSVSLLPQWSPDGRWIAYQEQDLQSLALADDAYWLSVVRPDGSGRRLLAFGRTPDTSDAEFVGNGTAWAWSPDSTRLAYVYTAKSLGVDAEGDSPLALGIVDVATGKKRLVAPLAAFGPRYNPLDFVDIVAGSDEGEFGFVANGVGWTWSPDGKQLAYVYPAKSLGVDKDGGSPLATWLVDVATGKRRVLTAGIEPTWSPDGSRVLVRRALTSGGGLWLVPARGGKARLLVPGVRTRVSEKKCFQVLADFDPAWSSDGQWVAFTHVNERSRAGGDGYCGRQYFTFFVVGADGAGLARALSAPATAVEWPADCSQLFLYRNNRRNGWIVPDAAGGLRFVALASGQSGDWHC